MGGYVAGSLAAAPADIPAPRDTIVIRDSGAVATTPGAPTRSPSPVGDDKRGRHGHSSDDGSGAAAPPEPGDLDTHGDDWGRHDDDDHGGDDNPSDDNPSDDNPSDDKSG